MILAFLLLSAAATYVACYRQNWFLATYLITWTILDLASQASGGDLTVGGTQFRATDAGTLALVIGCVYHMRRGSTSLFQRKPLIVSLSLILCYLIIKIVWAVVFGHDQLASNPIASQALGGLVGVVGEVRDSFMPFLLPFYAYVAPGSYVFEDIAWPLVTAVGVLLLRSAVVIAATGQIWSSSAEFRFISGQGAIALTLLSFILFFLRVPRVNLKISRSLAWFAFIVATVANHRSQWVGAVAGLAILLVAILAGRPLAGLGKRNRVLASSVVLALIVIATILPAIGSVIRANPTLAPISVRLYAITQPKKDADANWRETLWKDRIHQVGDDWPWGRLLGDRRRTFINGRWLAVPDHSAYVSTYELGGAILCSLMALFWGSVVLQSLRRLRIETAPQRIWPPAVAIAISATSLAFGSAYDFPMLAPALVTVLLLGSERRVPIHHGRATSPAYVRGLQLSVYEGHL